MSRPQHTSNLDVAVVVRVVLGQKYSSSTLRSPSVVVELSGPASGAMRQ